MTDAPLAVGPACLAVSEVSVASRSGFSRVRAAGWTAPPGKRPTHTQRTRQVESGSDLRRHPARAIGSIHSTVIAPLVRPARLPISKTASHGEADTATRPAFLSSLGKRCHRRRGSCWLELSPARDSALEVYRRGCGRHSRNPLLLLRSTRPFSALAAYHRREGYPKLAQGAEISTAARSITGGACRALQPRISRFGGGRI